MHFFVRQTLNKFPIEKHIFSSRLFFRQKKNEHNSVHMVFAFYVYHTNIYIQNKNRQGKKSRQSYFFHMPRESERET